MIVQKLRLQKGWTQEELAIVSGLSTRTIQRIERGQDPSPDSLKALAAVFDVDFQTLKEPAMDATLHQVSQTSRLAQEEALAFEHVRRVRGLYVQIIIYLAIISMLFAVNIYTNPHFLWVFFPALGWGFGLLVQGLRIFKRLPFWGAKWEKQQVEKYLGRKL